MPKLRPLEVLPLLIALVFAPAVSTQVAEPTILVVGDSISAGYGIKLSEGWVNLLERRLRANGFPHQVINASISGDTSRGGLARLPDALARHRPDFVILELGGNDALRGLRLTELKKNMAAMTELSQQSGARVLIAEMRIPPNYGPRYTEKFQAVFGELAERYQATLIPFMLEGVATDPTLMQQDGIHPRAKAQPLMLDKVWQVLEPLLKTS